jgi:heptosyltransferase-2
MRILVRGTNWIGDAVMSIPALRQLRRAFPEAHIALHTRAWADGLFRDADFIDEILPFEESGSNFRTVLNQARSIRRQRFDVAVIFPNSYRSAAIVKLAGIPRRFGYSKEGRRLLLTDPLRVPDWKDQRHEVHYYLDLVGAVSEEFQGSHPEDAEISASLPVSAERRTAARKRLADSGCKPGRPVVAIGPGSTNSRAKRWPADRFAELSDRLHGELGANVLVLGSREERDVAEAVKQGAAHPPIDLAGATSLSEAVAILAEADFFISNDMGLAHVAAAVGTRTLVIFGPTDPVTTRPFSDLAEVIREPVECSPCMLRDCPIDHRCMTRVTVDAVLKKASAALANRPDAG